MRPLRWMALVLALAWARPCWAVFEIVPYDPVTMQFPVSPEEALQAARNWAHNPGLQLNLRGVDRDVTLFEADYYLLESPDLNQPGAQQFHVDCYTGEIWWWVDVSVARGHQQRVNQKPPPPELPLAQRQQTATAFASTHYPGFAELGLQLWRSGSASHAFQTPIPGGGYSWVNLCVVWVDEFTGQVAKYVGVNRGPVTVSLQPTLTAEEAEAIAFNTYAGDPDVAVVFTDGPSELHVMLDSLRQQRLVWVVYTVVSDDPNMTAEQWEADGYTGATGWNVAVDAHNGEVIWHEALLGGDDSKKRPANWRSRRVRFTAPRQTRRGPSAEDLLHRQRPRVLIDGREAPNVAYPPLARNGAAYWYVGYLRSPLWRMRVGYLAGRATVVAADGRKAVIDTRSGEVSIDGVRVAGKHRPLVMKGRLYLPLALWERLTGNRFEWVAAQNALVISVRARGSG